MACSLQMWEELRLKSKGSALLSLEAQSASTSFTAPILLSSFLKVLYPALVLNLLSSFCSFFVSILCGRVGRRQKEEAPWKRDLVAKQRTVSFGSPGDTGVVVYYVTAFHYGK